MRLESSWTFDGKLHKLLVSLGSQTVTFALVRELSPGGPAELLYQDQPEMEFIPMPSADVARMIAEAELGRQTRKFVRGLIR